MVAKAPFKQSRVLSTQEVVFLEQIVSGPCNDPLDRLFSGHAVFVSMAGLYGQTAPWILKVTEDLEPDTGRGFLQCETLTTNTATSAKKKSTFTSYYLGMWSYRHSWYQA
jgi:hypothetical protein